MVDRTGRRSSDPLPCGSSVDAGSNPAEGTHETNPG
nr:MAG TPA: hypothetical protein [Caudoviricetes sp.]